MTKEPEFTQGDLERIEELHQSDMRASKKGDYATLRSIMSDDAVVLPPGGRLLRRREALDRSFASMTGRRVVEGSPNDLERGS